MQTRLTWLVPTVICCCFAHVHSWGAEARPNVVLIMTDDQGIGDFGATGNRAIETPNLDRLARHSAAMTTFYVSPVCSPTRACLMTGRYNYRTRCIDTFRGRSMMDPEEVTVAELLSAAGYATGIFGKWHLGDCYPQRPMDQGFQESLVLRGGGLAQPSEPRENNRRYTDAILFHNGSQIQTKGYCTDVFFDAGLNFIEQSHRANQNFFVYLSTNAPHGPFHDVPEELRNKYMQKRNLLAELIIPHLEGVQLEAEIDTLSRIAAMITNIDQNVGRLFEKLDQLQITENTLVIFLTDNGPATRRYVGNLRGKKSEVHEGGIRTVLWVHWPARLKAGYTRDELSAHIDLMPTILEACHVTPPENVQFDGRSLLPLLEGKPVDWADRTLAIQSHRGDVPVRYHNFMFRNARWKLVHPSGFAYEDFQGTPEFELYDIIADPDESQNLADDKPDILRRLRAAYDRWFDDVSSTRPDNYAPPRIWIGTPHEEETVLTHQDWRGSGRGPDSIGTWQLHVATSGKYDVHLVFDARPHGGQAELSIAGRTTRKSIEPSASSCCFNGVALSAGDTTLRTALIYNGNQRGVYQTMVKKCVSDEQPVRIDRGR